MNMEVPITEIAPNPWQTRRGSAPEHIKNLALDIAANGLLQTPVGRLMLGNEIAPVDEITAAQLTGEIPATCQVQLAFGHNRLAAFKWLSELGPFSDIGGDWSCMPVELKPLTDEQMAAFAWSENEKRRELSPVERAIAISRRIQDFGWSHEDAAENLGISRPSISNALRLLKLPEEVQNHLHAGEISERQAMAMIPLYEQPEEILVRSFYQYDIQNIVQRAINGESSDSLREHVNDKVNYWKRLIQPNLMDEPEAAPLSPQERLGEEEPTQERQCESQAQAAPEKSAPLSDIGWQTVIEPAEAISASPGPYQPAEPEPQTETLQTEPEPLSPRERLGERDTPQEMLGECELQTENWPGHEETQEPEPEESESQELLSPRERLSEGEPQAEPAENTGKLSLEQSTFTLTITLWPCDGDPMGRLTMLGARINEETPIMTMLREKELDMPHQVVELIYKLSQAYKQ